MEGRHRRADHGRANLHSLGLSQRATVSFENPSAHIHPSDRDRDRAAFQAKRAIVGPFETDFRIMLGSEIRWIAARGQGDDADIVHRTLYGVFIDVTGRKQAEESQDPLAGEVSHRVKNLLAIDSGLTEITPRGSASTVYMARELTQRLASLGRAHDLIHPLPRQDGRAALLGDLITIFLALCDDMGAFSGRTRVSVPRMGVGEVTAITPTLVLHELAEVRRAVVGDGHARPVGGPARG